MKTLTEDAVQRYRDTGYLAPIRVLPASEAAAIRAKLETFEAGAGALAGKLRQKSHLLFTWLNDLIRHDRILDAVEDIIGPDILCWGTSFFIKEPRNPAFVSWHQDSTYWGLDPADIVTAWVALSDSTPENGAMRVVPGSHTMAQIPHHDTFRPDNLLSRGQEVMVDVDASQAATLTLAAGEMSLHHVRLIHGSDPNPSATRRIGFAIRYLPTYVRQVAGSHDWATLVRGVDRHGNFELEQRPDADMSEAALAYHAAVVGGHTKILMRDTGRQMRA
ncbi:MAG: phytanoyl-CoA dioxygenase [Acetobacteraceae bacterium]|nr:phytanoyl-CoA dioxygenase [Acetobacteraceae bacterium]